MGEHQSSRQAIARLTAQLGPGPWAVATVRAAGWTASQVRAAVAAGRLERPHRGVLALPRGVPDPRPHVAAARALPARVDAALLTAPRGAIVSHVTAASFHGLWLPSRVRLDVVPVHLTVPGVHDDLEHGVRLHGSSLPSEEVVVLDGRFVTSVTRTAVDCARWCDLPDALALFDSAARLRGGRTGDIGEFRDLGRRDLATTTARASLTRAYRSVWRWPGSVVVRTAIPWLDAGSESSFESWSRGRFIQARVPMPMVGWQVVGHSGAAYFADFLWDEAGVIGEADGLGKYGETEREVTAALARERHRQRDLEDAGYTVIRWDSRESPDVWVARIRSALGISPRYVSQTRAALRHLAR